MGQKRALQCTVLLFDLPSLHAVYYMRWKGTSDLHAMSLSCRTCFIIIFFFFRIPNNVAYLCHLFVSSL